MDATPRRVYSQAEVSRMFGVSRATVTRWLNNGHLPWVGVGGTRRIPAAAIDGIVPPPTEDAA